MEKPIIEVKNLGKKYNITHQKGGYIALRDVLMNTIKSPFSFLKSKALKIAGMETKEEFWALKDVNFNVQKGEVIGIIGSNGAGKSTLLKILSQITPPTTGEIKIHGKVGSLLEVGTGFHPELTGRENIFLNGAILGMKKKEIVEKFDAIVEFAGIEKFLDTPVKHYSSGMYVRLAFSVAAHMEPDILIVDEVLAVGDAEFQKKCLGKMSEITQKDGRTILFVSHNLAAISNICRKVIVLENGHIIKFDETESAINFYQNRFNNQKNSTKIFSINSDKITFKDFMINDRPIEEKQTIDSGKNITICSTVINKGSSEWINMGYGILRKKDGEIILFSHAELEAVKLIVEGKSEIKATFKVPRLAPGEYFIEFHAWLNDQIIITKKEIGNFTIPATTAFKGGQIFTTFPSIIMTDSDWKIIKKQNEKI